jgi:hypothetical protein
MKCPFFRLCVVAVLTVVLTATFFSPRASGTTAVITIDDVVEGVLLLPTIIDQPPGVPGIENVVAGNEMITFTYDDLIPAAATRTRLLFLLEPGTGAPSDEFSWSVTLGSSLENILFISDPNPITIPTPCVANPDFFENSCDLVSETGSNVFTVETSGTQYILLSDVAEIPEPNGLTLFAGAMASLGLLLRFAGRSWQLPLRAGGVFDPTEGTA